LHIASYHYYLFFNWNALISFYQDYFNLSCHWHMNMCYLIGLRIHMLILFKRSLTKEQLNAKCEYGKMLWHSSCEKTTIIIPYYSWYSIPVFTLSTLFFPFIDHKFYKFVWFLKILLNKVCKLSGKYELFWIDWKWFLHSTLKKKQLIFHNSQHKLSIFMRYISSRNMWY